MDKPTPTTEPDDEQAVSPLRDDLQRIADDIRLQLHLGGMEAKDAWSRLEPRLSHFDRQASEVTSEVARGLKEVGQELRADLQKLKDSLSKSSD